MATLRSLIQNSNTVCFFKPCHLTSTIYHPTIKKWNKIVPFSAHIGHLKWHSWPFFCLYRTSENKMFKDIVSFFLGDFQRPFWRLWRLFTWFNRLSGVKTRIKVMGRLGVFVQYLSESKWFYRISIFKEWRDLFLPLSWCPLARFIPNITLRYVLLHCLKELISWRARNFPWASYQRSNSDKKEKSASPLLELWNTFCTINKSVLIYHSAEMYYKFNCCQLIKIIAKRSENNFLLKTRVGEISECWSTHLMKLQFSEMRCPWILKLRCDVPNEKSGLVELRKRPLWFYDL